MNVHKNCCMHWGKQMGTGMSWGSTWGYAKGATWIGEGAHVGWERHMWGLHVLERHVYGGSFLPVPPSLLSQEAGKWLLLGGRGSENGCKKLSQNFENEDHVVAVEVQPQKHFEVATTSLNITALGIMASKIWMYSVTKPIWGILVQKWLSYDLLFCPVEGYRNESFSGI